MGQTDMICGHCLREVGYVISVITVEGVQTWCLGCIANEGQAQAKPALWSSVGIVQQAHIIARQAKTGGGEQT